MNQQDKIDSKNISWGELIEIFFLKLVLPNKRTQYKIAGYSILTYALIVASLIILISGQFYTGPKHFIVPSKIEDASYFTQFEDFSTNLKALSVNQIYIYNLKGYLYYKFKYGNLLKYMETEKYLIQEKEKEVKMIGGWTHTDMVTNAYVAASKEAGLDNAYETKYTVMSIPSESKPEYNLNVNPGDIILSVDDTPIMSTSDIDYLTATNDPKKLKVLSLGKEVVVDSSLYSASIQVTNEVKDKKALQEAVKLFDHKYVGTSAGAAIAVELYSQFVEDVVKGRKIAITGTIDAEGNIGYIGGIVAKTILAHDNDIDIMFVPFDSYITNNYTDANKINKVMNSTMKIVPVNTLHEIIEYLKLH